LIDYHFEQSINRIKYRAKITFCQLRQDVIFSNKKAATNVVGSGCWAFNKERGATYKCAHRLEGL
ncbi:hypothetical protein, partial [Loigolactobacillus jiayinensis]|uniref:hypothetical protein n=1 Tax=Loigolactobacillus jiayinensis TaxID=2486016 RepID=UPI001CDB619E